MGEQRDPGSNQRDRQQRLSVHRVHGWVDRNSGAPDPTGYDWSGDCDGELQRVKQRPGGDPDVQSGVGDVQFGADLDSGHDDLGSLDPLYDGRKRADRNSGDGAYRSEKG